MTPLATYFLKSKLMARFQSHLCIGFHIKEDIIGDLKVPDNVLDFLFFVEMVTLVRLKPSHELRFWKKYVAKGVIGGLPAVALYTSGANWKMKSGIPPPGHLESKTQGCLKNIGYDHPSGAK